MTVRAITITSLTLVAALAVAEAFEPPAPGQPTVGPTNPVPGPKAVHNPSPGGPNALVFSRSGDLVRIGPDGKNEKKLTTGERLNPLTNNARVSPDGKRLVLLRTFVEGATTVTKLFVRGSGDKDPVTDLGVECTHIAWSADGTEIACSNVKEGENGSAVVTHLVVNMTTKETAPLDLPKEQFITDWSRDGKHFLTTSMNPAADPPSSEIHWWTRDGKGHKTLAGSKREAALYGQFSPDGTRVLYARFAVTGGAGDFAPGAMRMAILDPTTGKSAPVAEPPAGEIRSYCWSPDGKRIAYTWRELHSGKKEDLKAKETLSHLVICDPDGKNAKTVSSEKGPNPTADTIVEVSWR